MKSPFPVVLAALLGFAFAACGPAKVQAPDPNPVGQWQWSNEVLGSWRLEIKADGTFQREMKSPFDSQHVHVSGRWIFKGRPADPTWLERSGLSQTDPDGKAGLWSAPGTITFLYTSPRGADLAPGAVWTGTMAAQSSPDSPPEWGIEEVHPIRTHTDASGEVFLDLAGKVFQRSDQPEAAKTVAEEAAELVSKLPAPPTGNAATTPPSEPEFLTIEPFTGVTLDLAATWQGVAGDPAQKTTAPMAAMGIKPQMPKANAALRLVPPGEAQDTYISVSIHSVMFSPKQLDDSTQMDLDRFAAGFVKGASRVLEQKGYYLEPGVTADRVMLGQRSAIMYAARMVDPVGNRRSIRTFSISAETATVIMECCWDGEPGAPWKTIIERACSTLRVAESFKLP
ncbi:MAG: hypothetical protein WDN28_20045 [Chthoniobacter sp.]